MDAEKRKVAVAQKALERMRELGSKSDVVGDRIWREGIKGLRLNSAQCPLARYMAKLFSNRHFIMVNYDGRHRHEGRVMVLYIWLDRYPRRTGSMDPMCRGNAITVKVPGPVARFVREFDKGKHSTLEKI